MRMKELLENFFGAHYRSTKRVQPVACSKKGEFSYNDNKACSDCKCSSPDAEANCNHVVLHCDTGGKDVEVIELEEFLNHYSGLKALPSGRRCDLLMTGQDKVVFCDMTCSKAKYIAPFIMSDGTEKIGKRNTVRGQIESSINILVNVPEIATEINGKNDKIALFSYREKPSKETDDFDNRILTQMNKLNAIDTSLSSEPMFSPLDNGFLFTEVKYPNTYSW